MFRTLFLLPFALFACDVDQTREARAPEVRVEDEGQLPQYDVDAEVPEVDVETERRTIELPDIEVGSEKHEVEVPTIEVNPDEEGKE